MRMSKIYELAAAFVVLVGLAPLAAASCPNPNAVLNGTYGRLVEGLSGSGVAPAPHVTADFIPLVQVGFVTFDGNGNISGEHDSSLGGTLFPHNESGTYSVNSDCATGTLSFDNKSTSINFVITNGGAEIKLVYTQPGAVAPGTLRAMGTAACSAATLSGKTFGYAAHGLIGNGSSSSFPRSDGFFPFADSGSISFQNDGSLSGAENANIGGVLALNRPIVGTYSVNANCTGATTM